MTKTGPTQVIQANATERKLSTVIVAILRRRDEAAIEFSPAEIDAAQTEVDAGAILAFTEVDGTYRLAIEDYVPGAVQV